MSAEQIGKALAGSHPEKDDPKRQEIYNAEFRKRTSRVPLGPVRMSLRWKSRNKMWAGLEAEVQGIITRRNPNGIETIFTPVREYHIPTSKYTADGTPVAPPTQEEPDAKPGP